MSFTCDDERLSWTLPVFLSQDENKREYRLHLLLVGRFLYSHDGRRTRA